jgi:hypothetical protein
MDLSASVATCLDERLGLAAREFWSAGGLEVAHVSKNHVV